MTEFLARAARRRTLLKALLAVPAFSLFRSLPAPRAMPGGMPGGMEDDEIVEIGGWILKRSDVA